MGKNQPQKLDINMDIVRLEIKKAIAKAIKKAKKEIVLSSKVDAAVLVEMLSADNIKKVTVSSNEDGKIVVSFSPFIIIIF